MNGFNLISYGVAGALLLLFYFYRDARNMMEKAKSVVRDKTEIIQMDIIKTVWLISGTVTARLIKKVQEETNISRKGVLEKVSEGLGLLFKPREELKEMITKLEIPEKAKPLLKLEEEDQHRIFGLCVIISTLEEIPKKFSDIADNMIKAMIGGIFFIILMGVRESYALSGTYLSILDTSIIFAFLFFLWGVLSIWSLRKNDKKLGELEKTKALNEIERAIKW